MLDLRAGRERVERPLVPEADELRTRHTTSAKVSSGNRATITHSPFSRLP